MKNRKKDQNNEKQDEKMMHEFYNSIEYDVGFDGNWQDAPELGISEDEPEDEDEPSIVFDEHTKANVHRAGQFRQRK